MPLINHTFFDLWTAIIYTEHAFKRLLDCNYLHIYIQAFNDSYKRLHIRYHDFQSFTA